MKKNIWIIVTLILTILVHLSVFLVPISMLDGYFLIIKPMLWLIIGGFVFAVFDKKKRVYRDRQTFRYIVSLGIIVYLFVMFIAGVFMGFSYNPFNTTFLGLIRNFWTFVPIILIKEYVRSRIMQTAPEKSKYIILTLVTIVFAFVSLDTIRSVVTFSLGFQLDFILTTLFPLLVLNLFLSYSALNGAVGSNIAFQLIYVGLPIFLPVLPNVQKIFEAIMLYTSVFIMYIIYDKFSFERNKKEEKNIVQTKYHWKWMIAPALILTFCLLFAFGALPYVPVAVASDSMRGEFSKGDVVLVKKKDLVKKEIIEGQIIQFKTDKNRDVVHRITQIITTPQGEKLYITKGDNNNVTDSTPVRENQIVGLVEYKIPYIGWPSILLSAK